MLDSQGRIAIGNELIATANLDIQQGDLVNIYYDRDNQRILITKNKVEDLYFVRATTVDEKCRIFMPAQIRKIFPKSRYLPVEKDGNIYILII